MSKHEEMAREIVRTPSSNYCLEQRIVEALAQVEAETLERVIIAVRNERLFGETGTEGDIAYNVALDHAEQAIRSLSPNPTPTKGT